MKRINDDVIIRLIFAKWFWTPVFKAQFYTPVALSIVRAMLRYYIHPSFDVSSGLSFLLSIHLALIWVLRFNKGGTLFISSKLWPNVVTFLYQPEQLASLQYNNKSRSTHT